MEVLKIMVVLVGITWQKSGLGFMVAMDSRCASTPSMTATFLRKRKTGGIVVTLDNGESWGSGRNGIMGNDRRNWDMQYILSPHDPDVLYTGTYRVYQGLR